MHHHDSGLLAALLGLRVDQIGDPSRLLIHPPRHVEIGELETGLRALVDTGRGRSLDQRIQPREKVLVLVLVPFVEVEQRPHRNGGAFGSNVGR